MNKDMPSKTQIGEKLVAFKTLSLVCYLNYTGAGLKNLFSSCPPKNTLSGQGTKNGLLGTAPV
ncbi:MAG: hypothetical protein IPK21_20220 [Haliscomenobacter sp.]|nr:hypothetical protein [Haliscomenobacter sp.]